MRKTFYSFCLLYFLFVPNMYAQDDMYWQQEVNYIIDVKLDDKNHNLIGYLSLDYINHSPDTLTHIYFHLWPNAYKNRNTAFAKEQADNGSMDFHLSGKNERGYINQLDFKVNGRKTEIEIDKNNIDIAKLKLGRSLLPGQSVKVSTPFHVKIPKTFSRFGHVDQEYQICQWYPKPAVYDSKGWHPMPYRDQGEFYAEFGSYEVNIDIPANYIVGATGILQNKEEMEWVQRLSDETHKFLEEGIKHSSDFSERKGRKTLTFKQDNIHDFAWFASQDYRVISEKATLESGKEVTAWALFKHKDIDSWRHCAKYVADALVSFSKWLGDYPYDHCTAVQGPLLAGGGMEYPMITIIGENILEAKVLDEIIAHEVGHNWFQGILATNERDFPWMDEGLNSFYEGRYMNEKYGSGLDVPAGLKKLFGISMSVQELAYQMQVNKGKDQPIGLHSHDFSSTNYGVIVYMTTPLMLNGLEAYLGREEFDRSMQKYFNDWKFKHPYPEDLKRSFNGSGKNLDFFFDEIINTEDHVDYKFIKKSKDIKKIGGIPYAKLKIGNKGFISAPFTISGMKDDTVVRSTWYDGFNGEMEVLFKDGDFDAYRIDANNYFPDINKKNNTLQNSGCTKRMPPIKLRPFISFEDPNHTEILYSPLALWNKHDGAMLGLGVYNGFVFEKMLEYGLSPMYGFRSEKLVGSARLGVNFKALSSLSIKKVSMHFSSTRFSYDNHSVLGALEYNKLMSKTSFIFRPKKGETNVERRLDVRTALLFRDYAKKYITYYDKEEIWERKTLQYNLVDAVFSINKKKGLSPYKLDLRMEAGERLIKCDLTYNTKFRFNKRSNLNMRFFAGGFLYNENNSMVDYRYRMSGYRGQHDYWYDNLYAARTSSSGIWSQQAYNQGGGFKTLTPVGQTNNWLAALNFDFSLPWKLPIRIFADVGTYHNAGYDVPGYTDWVVYDLGICVKTGFLNVYLPLLMSPDLKNAMDANSTKYMQRVSLFLNLNAVNPYKIREILP